MIFIFLILFHAVTIILVALIIRFLDEDKDDKESILGISCIPVIGQVILIASTIFYIISYFWKFIKFIAYK